jgi:hypothetical protein
MMKQSKKLLFWCKFASSICPIIQVDSNLYPPCSVAIFLATVYIESFTSLEFLITVRHYSTKFLRRRSEANGIAPKCRRLRLNSRRRRYVVGIDWLHQRLLPLYRSYIFLFQIYFLFSFSFLFSKKIELFKLYDPLIARGHLHL